MKKFKPGVSFGDFVVTEAMSKRGRVREELAIDYRRGWVIWLVVIVMLGVLVVRLGALQLFAGGKYRILSDENRIKKIRLVAPRGRILDKNGQDLFVLGEASAHVTGYISEVNEQEVGLLRDLGTKYELGSMIGRGGLQQQYESKLRGVDGGRLVEINPAQQIVRELGKEEPVPGTDLMTTMDINLQKTAFEAINGKKGAVVVANPQTGAVLALVSSPGFDPKHINGNSEFFNRAIGGIYPPGSTFKMVTTIAALMEKKADPSFTFEDVGVINIGKFAYTNWFFTQYGRTEGVVGWTKALARSTDTFFYKVGEITGSENLAKWAEKLGLGVKTGIDLPGEVGGLIPTPEWKLKVKGEQWFLGNTYHMAIGQGDILVTPLQVNLMTNVIAARGEKCQLHIYTSPSNPSPKLGEGRKGEVCERIGVDSNILDIVQSGMIGACSSGGTAFPLFDFKPQVACKTGTAEYVRSDGRIGTHAWLTAFAPADNPQISVTVLVEGGGEGSVAAAPIARKILAKYFGVEDKYNYGVVVGVGE